MTHPRIKDTLMKSKTKAIAFKAWQGQWMLLKPLGQPEYAKFPPVMHFDSFDEMVQYINNVKRDEVGFYYV